MTRGMDFCFRVASLDNLDWGLAGGIGALEGQLSIALFHSAKLSIRNSNRPLIFVYLSMSFLTNHLEENQTSLTSRLTLQYINDSRLGRILPVTIPNNSDSRELGDIANWPPAVVLYAAAALRARAPESFIQTVRAMAKDICYKASPDDGYTSTPCEAPKRLLDARSKKKVKATHSKKEMPDLMDGIMALWTLNSAKQGKGNLERTTAVKVARSREKVQAWIDSEAEFNSRAVTEGM
jgi:hypothetical protein